MPIAIYDTREMIEAIKRMKPVRSFLRDTFFSQVKTFVAESIDVDFKKGKRTMAPFVAPRVGGIPVDRIGHVTRNYKVPKIAPDRVMTIDNITSRGMGEALYSAKTPEQRAAELMAEDITELEKMIVRREEWMCREVLLSGKVTMKGLIDGTGSDKYIEQVVDYSFTNTETLSGTAKWNSSAPDIQGDLERWQLSVTQKTGLKPNVAIMASDVIKVYKNDPKVQTIYNIRNFNVGQIAPRIVDDAVTFFAYIPELDLQIYSYNEWFLDDSGTETAMIPSGKVILARVGMGRRFYGAVTQMEPSGFVTYEAPRVPKNFVDVKNDIITVRLSSRPLPVPEDVDDWFVATVL